MNAASALARLLPPLLLAFAAAVAVTATGALFTRSRARISEAFLIGYPIFGTICFLIALVSTNRWLYVALIVGLIGLAARLIEPVRPRFRADLVPAALMGVALALAAAVAQLPAVSLDELAYHLTVPKTWVLEGRSIELPLLSHSYFPLGIESANLPLLSILGNDGAIAAHFLHLLSAVAAAVTIHSRLRKRSEAAAWAGTLAVVSTPALLSTAGFAWNDWPLVGIAVVLYGALEDDHREIASASIAAGLLTKYTFAPLAAVLLLARLLAAPPARPGTPRNAWRHLLPVAVGSVFYLRNLVLTANPFAPFLSSGAPVVSGFRSAGLLFYIFDPRFIDEALGLAVIVAVLGVFFAERGFGRIAGLVSLLLAACLLALTPSARILMPSLAVAVLGGAIFLERRAVRTAIVLAAAAQIALTTVYVRSLDPLQVLTGAVSDDAYLRQHRASFADIEQVNLALPSDARPLVIGLNELFWFDEPARGGGNFDGPRVNAYVESEDLAARLRRDGITHVALFAPRQVSVDPRKREERATMLSPRALENLRNLEGTRVPVSPGAAVIELRP
jgi:hypothetical protein